MRRIATWMAPVAAVLLVAAAVANSNKVSVYLDGRRLEAAGRMVDNTVYLPVRAVAEALEISVSYDALLQRVNLSRGAAKPSTSPPVGPRALAYALVAMCHQAADALEEPGRRESLQADLTDIRPRVQREPEAKRKRLEKILTEVQLHLATVDPYSAAYSRPKLLREYIPEIIVTYGLSAAQARQEGWPQVGDLIEQTLDDTLPMFMLIAADSTTSQRAKLRPEEGLLAQLFTAYFYLWRGQAQLVLPHAAARAIDPGKLPRGPAQAALEQARDQLVAYSSVIWQGSPDKVILGAQASSIFALERAVRDCQTTLDRMKTAGDGERWQKVMAEMTPLFGGQRPGAAKPR